MLLEAGRGAVSAELLTLSGKRSEGVAKKKPAFLTGLGLT